MMWRFIAAAVSIALLAAAQQSGEAETLLQAAIHKEVAEGQLEQAIEIYRQVAAKHRDRRATAAQALVRMGQCYEKLGRAEAQRAYEQVVREFGDQAEAARLARQRLAALGRSAAAKPVGLSVRKIWSERLTDYMGAPSDDGRFLSFVDWETGDLAVRDLESGANRRLTDKGPWEKSSDFALFSRWSPDGQRLAYDWYLDDTTSMELRTIGLAGGQPKVVARFGKDEWIQTYDWSPDGKWILVFQGMADRVQHMALYSAADGAMKILKTFRGPLRWPAAMRFSPDGRRIAYDLGPGDPPDYDVFVFDLGRREERRLVEHPAQEFLLDWTPDGSAVLFASDRTGAVGFWTVSAGERDRERVPRLIKADVGRVVPLGLTRAGTFFYASMPQMADVFVASLDPASGKAAAPPATVIRSFEGTNSWPEYSPDGKRLAYVSARGRFWSNATRGSRLLVRDLATGREREYPGEFLRLAGTRWSPDGQSIFIAGWEQNGYRIYRVDLRTGDFSEVVRPEADGGLHSHEVSRDGRLLFFVRTLQRDCRITVRDLARGDERVLYRGSADRFLLALSPDGTRLAFINQQPQKVMYVMPAAGGEARELLRFESSGYSPLAWSPDGKYLFHARREGPDPFAKSDLWRVAVDTGKAEKLPVAMANFGYLSVHPDGQQLAFSSQGTSRRFHEVWAMEDFLPAAPAR